MSTPIYTSGNVKVYAGALGDSAEAGAATSWRKNYVVRGAANAEAAAAVLRAYAVSLGGNPLLFRCQADEVADGYCRASIDYGFANLSPVSFSTTGSTTHLNQSYNTRAKYAATGSAPDYQGAIGVSANGVAGVDVTVPAFNFSVRKKFEFVSTAYLSTIVSLTGKVNSDPWQIFAPGEVLFLGADGGEDSENFVDITYQFAARANESGLSFGSITGVAKRGWDYLWVKHDEEIVGDRVLQVPAAVYVEEIYPSAPFAPLGLNS